MVPSVFSRGQAIAIGLTSTGLRDAAMLIDLIDPPDPPDAPDPPDPSDLAYLYQYGVFCAQTLFG